VINHRFITLHHIEEVQIQSQPNQKKWKFGPAETEVVKKFGCKKRTKHPYKTIQYKTIKELIKIKTSEMTYNEN
jgi:hypothetical protein